MVITNIKDAIKWLIDNYGGQNDGAYIDRTNKNFLNKVVGYRYTITGKHWKKFLVTCRPRGVTSFTKAGKGAMTMMNLSEINAQIKEGRDRLVVFQEQDVVRAYVFKTSDIVKSIETGDAEKIHEFKKYPNESEAGYNIPIKIGVNLSDFLEQD